MDVSATSVAPALGTPPSSYSSGTLMFSELATVYQTNPRGIQYNQIRSFYALGSGNRPDSLNCICLGSVGVSMLVFECLCCQLLPPRPRTHAGASSPHYVVRLERPTYGPQCIS